MKHRIRNTLLLNHLPHSERRLNNGRTADNKLLVRMADTSGNHAKTIHQPVRRARLNHEDDDANSDQRIVNDRKAMRWDIVSKWKHGKFTEIRMLQDLWPVITVRLPKESNFSNRNHRLRILLARQKAQRSQPQRRLNQVPESSEQLVVRT